MLKDSHTVDMFMIRMSGREEMRKNLTVFCYHKTSREGDTNKNLVKFLPNFRCISSDFVLSKFCFFFSKKKGGVENTQSLGCVWVF